MSAAVALDPARPVLDQLRARVAAMEGGPARLPVPVLPALSGLVTLRAGGSYAVDSASLALALVAGASQAGEWVGFAGWPDFGAEAAAELGIDLARTVLVPDPGEHWLEVTAALVDVMGCWCCGRRPGSTPIGECPRRPAAQAVLGAGGVGRLAALRGPAQPRGRPLDRSRPRTRPAPGATRPGRRTPGQRAPGPCRPGLPGRGGAAGAAGAGGLAGRESLAGVGMRVQVLVVWCPDWSVVAALREAELSATEPAAVLAANVVEVCNGPARAEGVRRGQRRRDAQARCPELVLLEANPDRDARCFEPVLETVEALRPGSPRCDRGCSRCARRRATSAARPTPRRSWPRPSSTPACGTAGSASPTTCSPPSRPRGARRAGVRAGRRGRLGGVPPRPAGRGARGRRRRRAGDGQPAAPARAPHPRRPGGAACRRRPAPLRRLRCAGLAPGPWRGADARRPAHPAAGPDRRGVLRAAARLGGGDLLQRPYDGRAADRRPGLPAAGRHRRPGRGRARRGGRLGAHLAAPALLLRARPRRPGALAAPGRWRAALPARLRGGAGAGRAGAVPARGRRAGRGAQRGAVGRLRRGAGGARRGAGAGHGGLRRRTRPVLQGGRSPADRQAAVPWGARHSAAPARPAWPGGCRGRRRRRVFADPLAAEVRDPSAAW